jgi:PemK-like, MazF-like toxin of type II toxin-antitoxin system
MVIRYGYLWLHEHERGQEEGKDRPAAVIIVLEDEALRPLVTVLPITHAAPIDLAAAVEIPSATKQRLGLDADRSWILLNEANDFRWPGPDLRPIPGKNPSTVVYGILPPDFFQAVRRRVIERVRSGDLARLRRTE